MDTGSIPETGAQRGVRLLRDEVERLEGELAKAEDSPAVWVECRFELFCARMQYWEELARLEFEDWQRLQRNLGTDRAELGSGSAELA